MLGVGWVSAHAAGPDPGSNTGRIAEHITLKNGFDLICDHRAAEGAKVRLYMDAAGSNFMEVNAGDIASAETVTLPAPAPEPTAIATIHTGASAGKPPAKLTDEDLRPMLSQAGATYDIDADLLASVVRQESGGQTHAVSRAGAQGLMQLMPGTAAQLGVADSFAPGENIQGGTAYLDMLLKRYNDNLALALAAYNAGPAAVDHWHGIPPYRETRAYVARVIHEYNRRYALRRKQMAALAN
jgi:soluble lytic murein transglycosylase-like protein